MQAADNVKSRAAFANTLLRARVNSPQRKRVRAGRAGIAAKRAQLAVRHENIGRINVPIDVKVRDIPVSLLANVIRQPPNRQQIRRAVKRYAVLKSETLSGEHLVCNGLQPLFGNGQFRHVLNTSRLTYSLPVPASHSILNTQTRHHSSPSPLITPNTKHPH